jgi:hypothetical protein
MDARGEIKRPVSGLNVPVIQKSVKIRTRRDYFGGDKHKYTFRLITLATPTAQRDCLVSQQPRFVAMQDNPLFDSGS